MDLIALVRMWDEPIPLMEALLDCPISGYTTEARKTVLKEKLSKAYSDGS